VTRIKFCGLTLPHDAELASALGASYGGVILSESPRRITPSTAAEVFNAAPGLRRVGVFRHRPVAEVITEALQIGLDAVQLHGRSRIEEIEQLRESFDGEIWAVFPLDAALPGLPEDWSETADRVDAVLVDTSAGGRSGGTGVTFDWELALPLVRNIAARTELIVAGGLTPLNVAQAIRTLGPGVVDVSSGVESAPGVKDPSLMKAFAQAVRSASIV
jgi:phosphoribosylanthranilate isomerase